MSEKTPSKPLISMHAIFNPSENTFGVSVAAGRVPAGEWKWRILDPTNKARTEWTDGVGDLEPESSPVELARLDNVISGSWTVQIIHVPTNSTYPDLNVLVRG
jgi:hypothetical protein